ncbi:methionine/alanine import family NSS transporter small subunit [Nocardioides sp.]|nr:methionine/alanine import family NSS transporter small subunit [Nocardioides sp.]MBJ7357806.1 methionine/alanine import family NSS transporter small subunit [Nocardioides sp.]
MTASAIVMMIVAIVVVWGGLALAIHNLSRTTREEPDEVHRDL